MSGGKISVRLTSKNWVLVNGSIVGRYSMQHKYISLESSAKWVIGTTKHMIPCPDRDKVISTILKEIEECKPNRAPLDPSKCILPAGHEYQTKNAYWEECKHCQALKPLKQ